MTAADLLSVDDAQRLVLAGVGVVGAEVVSIVNAGGRVLAAELVSRRDVPAFDNSAMDGVGVRAADVASAPVKLKLVGTSLPGGAPVTSTLGAGEAVRIMTGAPIPAGVDAIVMRELTDESELGAGVVGVKEAAARGQHVRARGEDVAVGGVVGRAGDVVHAARMNLLLSTGHVTARVHKRPSVAVLASGDELKEVGEALGDKDVVNSNAWAVAAAAAACGCEVRVLGIAGDSLDAHVEKLAEAASSSDVVVSIGGVSMGTHDFVRPALAKLGVTLEMWKVAMRPGKPIAFGTRGSTCFFGLPGNPVSALVSFELFVRPSLKKLRGERSFASPFWPATLVDSELKKKPGLEHYARGIARLVDGRLLVRVHPAQGSHHISALADANALVRFPRDGSGAAEGASVDVLLLDAPLLPSAML